MVEIEDTASSPLSFSVMTRKDDSDKLKRSEYTSSYPIPTPAIRQASPKRVIGRPINRARGIGVLILALGRFACVKNKMYNNTSHRLGRNRSFCSFKAAAVIISLSLFGGNVLYVLWSSQNLNLYLKNSMEEINPMPKKACNPSNFLVLIKSGAKTVYQERRDMWRNSTCPTTYSEHGMPYRFMIGMPAYEKIDPDSHNQGHRASDREILAMEKLEKESHDNKDIHFLGLPDVYEIFSFKTFNMFQWAIDRGVNDDTVMVIFHDDEYCLRPKILQDVCEKADLSNSSLYAGNNLWRKADYEMQKGIDGSFSPYFSGWAYALSTDLIKDIVSDPATLFSLKNLGFMGDLQVGKWVDNQAKRKDHPEQIKYVEERSLIWSVEEGEEKK